MNEKLYKSVSFAGVTNLVMGILALVGGVTMGILLITSSVKLLKGKNNLVI